MALSPSSLLLPLGSGSGKTLSTCCHGVSCDKVRGVFARCSNMKLGVRASGTRVYGDEMNFIKRTEVIGLVLGVSSLLLESVEAKAAGLPPEEKPRLCDQICEKELENVPMVTTESGLQYKDIKVGGPSPPIGFQVRLPSLEGLSI
ncbi:hypothetical protein Patl1_26626 [Pistacia atlantica]|uniref:Uncharacterized protein n=1 Tax=Pistacia atlantica TaxID=434234 RepID=A0ACC1B278_9ROSI|nr:hypothetical protein Patl1_26626 [Pistacia atlantica]